MIDQLLPKWHQHFGSSVPDVIVRAPGRVNIIGEHTDYNEGWVMPGAMSRSVYILIAKNNTGHQHWIADNLNDEFKGSLAIPQGKDWVKYIHGAMEVYGAANTSFNILVGGDLPVGAGVSSSSALLCGLIYGFQKILGGEETRETIALLGSRVEREIMGLQGGIMDQFAIMLSRQGKVMMLDCRKRLFKYLPAELPGSKWCLINSKVSHKLIDSDYNVRAKECADAVRHIQKKYPVVRSLRDVTIEMLIDLDMSPLLLNRTVYVLQENKRVHEMAAALKHHDAEDAGNILKRSHKGLREKYEVSCAELDHLADYANNYKGVWGARMMGGGFGGCLLCLVKNSAMEGFIEGISNSYQSIFGITPDIIDFEFGDGVTIVE